MSVFGGGLGWFGGGLRWFGVFGGVSMDPCRTIGLPDGMGVLNGQAAQEDGSTGTTLLVLGFHFLWPFCSVL